MQTEKINLKIFRVTFRSISFADAFKQRTRKTESSLDFHLDMFCNDMRQYIFKKT